MAPFQDDDDFGQLYATPPSNAIPDFDGLYIDLEEADADADSKSNDANLNQHDDSVCGQSTHPGSDVKQVDDDYIGSDSDDDLNIVLNDDDAVGCVGNRRVATGAGCDEDGDGFVGVTEGTNLGKDGNCGDRLVDGSELVSFNANGAHCKNGVMKGGYGSRFFHHKVTTSMGMASYCSSLSKGRWNGNGCIQSPASSSCHVSRLCAAANPMMAQYGYGSFLPWSIFEVNIDVLKEKPWMIPGVDTKDYFNFGFNENTWKQYCASLEQLWQTSMQTGIPVEEYVKLNQEAMTEQIDQVVSESVLSHSSECEVPKGRAIQVEDSLVERQPSVDVRRPRNRDSDVIQIKVLESSDDFSVSGNSIVMGASLGGESFVGNKGNILSSSSERENVLSEEQLDDVKKSQDSSVQERNGLIPGVDEDEHQDQEDQHSEDTAEAPGEEIEVEEGIGTDTCSTDQCWVESELSLGDQELSLTSYPDSDSEATGNSILVKNDKIHSPLRTKSVNSVTGLKEFLPLYQKNSKNNSFNRKPANIAYYSRNKDPARQQRRHQGGRHEPCSKLNKHPISRARDLSLLGHQFVDYDRQKERLQDFGSHKRRDVSYNRETKKSCYYNGEKVVDDLVDTGYAKYSYGEGRDRFSKNTNRYCRKIGDEREYFFEPRTLMADNEDRERDWYQADRRHTADDPSAHSHRESRQFPPKYLSFPTDERDTQRRRIHDNSHFRDRNCSNDRWFDECELEFLNKGYRMSAFSAERKMESLDNKHEEQFPHIDRELKRSAGRGRHCERPPLVLDNLWSGKMEDKCRKYTDHLASNLRYCKHSYTDSETNYVHGTRVNEKHARDNRGGDCYCGHTDAAEDGNFIIHPVEEYEFYSSPSKVLNWTEDGIILRHREMHATSLLAKVQIDDIKLQQYRLNMRMRGNESCLKGSSKIICPGSCGQAALRCRKSVDVVNGEGKSHARSSRVLCNGRLENNVDQGIAKKRRVLVGFDESHKKAIKSDISKSERNHENKKWHQNHADKGQKGSLDIEEGEIVTEEPYTGASVSRRDVSEGAALTDSVKKRMVQNENNSDWDIGGYDSQRILDSLAKMEKRRERFKQPINMKKEAEESLKLSNDSISETGEMKQHRPARKRRWVV